MISTPSNRSSEYLGASGIGQPDRDLISLISGVPPTPLSPRDPEDSRELLRLLLASWQILPSITDEQLDGALARVLSPVDYVRLCKARLAIVAFAKAQIVACWPLLQALEQRGLNYCLLKGSATAFILYPSAYMRGAWDFDIGVEHTNLKQAEETAKEFGYLAAQQDSKTSRFYRADPKLRTAVESTHYELGFLVRRLQVTNLSPETLEAIRTELFCRQYWFDTESAMPCCYASVDIHHAVSLDIPLDYALAHAHKVLVNGQSLRVPDDSWLAAHLVFKIYWEGVHSYGKGLYEYADLVRLMPRLDEAIFLRLAEILERHNLLAAGHYVLRRLPQFGVSLPQCVIDFLLKTGRPSPASDPGRLNDLGDMWPKIWGRR